MRSSVNALRRWSLRTKDHFGQRIFVYCDFFQYSHRADDNSSENTQRSLLTGRLIHELLTLNDGENA